MSDKRIIKTNEMSSKRIKTKRNETKEMSGKQNEMSDEQSEVKMEQEIEKIKWDLLTHLKDTYHDSNEVKKRFYYWQLLMPSFNIFLNNISILFKVKSINELNKCVPKWWTRDPTPCSADGYNESVWEKYLNPVFTPWLRNDCYNGLNIFSRCSICLEQFPDEEIMKIFSKIGTNTLRDALPIMNDGIALKTIQMCKKNPFIQTSCTHFFHVQCIRQWLDFSNGSLPPLIDFIPFKCPLCTSFVSSIYFQGFIKLEKININNPYNLKIGDSVYCYYYSYQPGGPFAGSVGRLNKIEHNRIMTLDLDYPCRKRNVLIDPFCVFPIHWTKTTLSTLPTRAHVNERLKNTPCPSLITIDENPFFVYENCKSNHLYNELEQLSPYMDNLILDRKNFPIIDKYLGFSKPKAAFYYRPFYDKPINEIAMNFEKKYNYRLDYRYIRIIMSYLLVGKFCNDEESRWISEIFVNK